ncbi:MAG: 16S rRNA (cytosine(1402)-N(4))-methyltransferase RsmH [Planctomycetaceae bacterium]|nr:16S rRNA (cytosine(1402)-N(4))-methyltransferase RsmH [Planctomycetaceae bacterium]
MPSQPTQHVPVMLDEVLEWLAPAPGKIIVDGTLGGGGHTRALAERVEPGGFVVSLDRDPAVIARAEQTLRGLSVKLAQSNFCDFHEVLQEIGVAQVDGVLLDLGLSSDQLADAERGFSFDADGPLDLRFDTESGQPASTLVNRMSAEDLANLIYEYGEERHSRRIARAIVDDRKETPFTTAQQLAQLLRRVVPRSPVEKIDPATRTFQALRIAVNDELGSLDRVLERLPEAVKLGGRVAIISFHSLEDRRVKNAFRDDPRWQVLTRKPLTAQSGELNRNPRARSAKLRVAERVAS